MKKYIFITADIHPIGGMQNYVASKANYLKQNEWNVYILYDGNSYGNCIISSLNEYIDGHILELSLPPCKWPKCIRNSVLNRIINMVFRDENDEIIIESHNDSYSQWGEILASRINAKHLCFICNEIFRGNGKYYENALEFYDFKHKRKELAGIAENSLMKLFEGYKTINISERYILKAANDGPVQDVVNTHLDLLKRSEWNICYIGRITKPYVQCIIKDVASFAQKYSTKQIQFIIVGDATSKKKEIDETFQNVFNLKIIYLGNLVPIPRTLFSKIDVVIAGSGCADCAAREGIPTILADAGNYLANGLLGYDTFNIIYHEENIKQMSYDSALERVLVKKAHKNMKFSLPEKESPDYYFEKHFDFLQASSNNKIYFNEKVLCKGQGKFLTVLKFYVLRKIKRIILKIGEKHHE